VPDEKVEKKPKRVYKLKGRKRGTPAVAAGKAPPEGFIETLQDVFVDAAVAGEDEKKLSDAKNRFYVRDHRSAAWAAGKIAMWQNEIERRKERVKKYVADAEKTLERLKWLFWEALKEWAQNNLDHGKKSVTLESATLQFRATEARLDVIDEDVLKKWAIVNCPDAIDVIENVLLDPLKNFWSANGVVPAGTKEVPAGENFSVKD